MIVHPQAVLKQGRSASVQPNRDIAIVGFRLPNRATILSDCSGTCRYVDKQMSLSCAYQGVCGVFQGPDPSFNTGHYCSVQQYQYSIMVPSLVRIDANEPLDDILKVIERDGGAIVTNFLSPELLEELMRASQS